MLEIWSTHNQVAKLLCEKIGDIFVCSSIKDQVWYEYKNHHWTKINLPELTDTLVKYLVHELELSLVVRNKQLCNHQFNKQLSDWLCNINLFNLAKIKNKAFQKGVVAEFADMVYDSGFIKKLDTNCHLIGFNDGVYDLKAKLFRAGNPDDYISLTTGYDYLVGGNDDKDINRSIKKWLKKVLPDKTTRLFLMETLAGCLAGPRANQAIVVFTGGDENGRRSLARLIGGAFGLLSRRVTNYANLSSFGNYRGIRFSILESSCKADVSAGFLKSLVGGDTYCDGKGNLYKLDCTPMLFCNQLPNFCDAGMMRRLKLFSFDQQTKNLLDTDKLAPALMRMLIKYHLDRKH